jgi:hypothetical protein
MFCELQWTVGIIHVRPLLIREDPLGIICLLKIRMGEGRCGCRVTRTFSLQFSVLHSEPHASNDGQLLQSDFLRKS